MDKNILDLGEELAAKARAAFGTRRSKPAMHRAFLEVLAVMPHYIADKIP